MRKRWVVAVFVIGYVAADVGRQLATESLRRRAVRDALALGAADLRAQQRFLKDAAPWIAEMRRCPHHPNKDCRR